jgi:hypothetical protein
MHVLTTSIIEGTALDEIRGWHFINERKNSKASSVTNAPIDATEEIEI